MSDSQPDSPIGGVLLSAKASNVLDVVIAEADANEDGLKRTMGPVSLTSIGVAAVVGAGIFVVTGTAAANHAGPAVILSFVIAGIAALLAALCYAEIAAMVPLSGSTYSYAYAALPTIIAWIIGWDLLLEYLFGAANVSVGWAGYATQLLGDAGIHLPQAILAGPIADTDGAATGLINLPAVALVAFVTIMLILGTRESAAATTIFVGVKLLTLAIFVAFGITAITASNYSPFIPPRVGDFGGWEGVIAGAAAVFYSYISFDAVCTGAQEAKNPRRTVPIGIMASLGIATLVYIVVGAVLVGLTSYANLGVPDALSVALDNAGLHNVGVIVDIGATVGLAASVLALVFAQTRILMRMSEDGMLPNVFRKVDVKRGTPVTTIVVCGVGAAIMAGFLPLSTLTEMISIGTLLAFMIVAAAVIALRKSKPDLPRPFKVPGGATIPIISIIVSFLIMLQLDIWTWLRLIVWLVIGGFVYFLYSKKRSQAVIQARLDEHNAWVKERAEHPGSHSLPPPQTAAPDEG